MSLAIDKGFQFPSVITRLISEYIKSIEIKVYGLWSYTKCQRISVTLDLNDNILACYDTIEVIIGVPRWNYYLYHRDKLFRIQKDATILEQRQQLISDGDKFELMLCHPSEQALNLALLESMNE